MQAGAQIRNTLEQKPYIIAIFISLLIILWMVSGLFTVKADEDGPVHKAKLPKVKVERLQAKPVNKSLQLYGRTEPDKVAVISAREPGEVIEIHVQEGQFVEQGTAILSLDKADLEQQISAAQALLEQREVEYQGANKLKQKGLNDAVALARAQSNLEMAKSQLSQVKLQLKRTHIVAPFSGIINKRMVEVGDYLGRGDPILELADLDPLIVRADVTQSEVLGLKLGQAVNASILNGSRYQGDIRYIASVADDGTNTFKVEAKFDNPNMKLPAGFSTQLDIDVESVNAVHLSPAFMALDENGNIGVKTIDDDNRVVFTPINIVKSEPSGVWMTGLGENVKVITLGQGFVRIGDQVDPVISEQE